MSDYLVREDTPNSYTVSKWELNKEPESVYIIKFNQQRGWKCNCPAGSRGSCKHPEVVKKWIRNGKKEMKYIQALASIAKVSKTKTRSNRKFG